MKRILSILLILIFSYSFSQDTIYVTSKTDSRLLLFQDSLNAYQTGISVCNNLKILFRELTNNNDYDAYFTDGWNSNIKDGDRVDTLLGESYFQLKNDWPSVLDQFHSLTEIGSKLGQEFKRLDTLKVRPYGQVLGAEMPTIFIYKKPDKVVIYKKIDHCWEKKRIFTTCDLQTHFLINDDGKTITPYNIIRYYLIKPEHDELIKIEWVDPVDRTRLIKQIKFKTI